MNAPAQMNRKSATLAAVCGVWLLQAAELPTMILFKDSAVVNDTVIRVRDIARIQGGTASLHEKIGGVIIGEPAPAGYIRFMNTGDALLCIRRAAGAAVESGFSYNKRIAIRTIGIVCRVSDFDDLICGSIAGTIQWPAADYSITIDSSSRKWYRLDKPYTASLSGLKTSLPRGATRLELKIIQGDHTMLIPFTVTIAVNTPVVVTKRMIATEAVIGPDDIQLVRKEITDFRYEPCLDPAIVVGRAAARTLQPEMIMHEDLLKKAPVVQKGDCVKVSVKSGAVKISVEARARASGAIGDRILVENLESHKLMQVIIQEPGRVTLPVKESL
jgi:flagella basal body P-ring formation protein FlgA